MDATSFSARAPLPAIGALWSGAWGLYKRRFGTFVGIVAIPLVLSLLSALSAPSESFDAVRLLLAVVVGLVAGVLSVAAYAGLIVAMREPMGIRAAYRRGFSRFFSYLWISILTALVVAGGTVMAFVPGIIFSIWFLFGAYVMLLEEKRGMEALMRSREYVRGYWWPVFGRLLLFMLFVGAIFLVLGIPAGLFEATSANKEIVSAALNIVLQILLVPFGVAYLYTLYEQLRGVRPELVASPAPTRGRGFFIFSGILGIGALIALLGFAILVFFIFRPQEGSGYGIPESQLKNARDSTRLTDLQRLETWLNEYAESDTISCVPGKIYKSTEGSTALDGTGWLPVKFQKIFEGRVVDETVIPPPPPQLPLDPLNSTEYFYSFACDPNGTGGKGSYELNAILEGGSRFTSYPRNDGGNNPNVYEIGTAPALDLIP